MFKKLLNSLSSSSSGLPNKKAYQRYRKAGMELNHKIIDSILGDSGLLHSAKALGMKGPGRQLILDSADDMSVLMDYMLYEYRAKDRNAVERYQAEVGAANQIEAELLAAMVSSSTSLFKINSVSQRTASLHLSDLLNQANSLTLMDINFSQSCVPGLLLFIRPIILENFSMTSGMAFVFPGQEEQFLLKQALHPRRRGQSPRESAKRYQAFYKLSKRRGIDVMYG
jgi:hypothetical protein